jgi:hypothetical protein
MPATRIAKWDGQQWSGLGGGVDGAAMALTPINSGARQGLYVAGSFQNARGIPSPRLAKWGPGNQWQPIGLDVVSGQSVQVYTLLADADATLYAGGYFTTTACEPAVNIARWTHSVPSGPTLLKAVSVKPHGGQIEHGIELPLAGEVPGVECRNAGPTKLVFTFSADVMVAPGLPAVVVSTGTVDDISITGAEMSVALHGVPDRKCVTVGLYGIRDATGQALIGKSTVQILALQGDVDGDQDVDAQDMAALIGRCSGPDVTQLNTGALNADLDADGDVDQDDFGLLQAAITTKP